METRLDCSGKVVFEGGSSLSLHDTTMYSLDFWNRRRMLFFMNGFGQLIDSPNWESLELFRDPLVKWTVQQFEVFSVLFNF